MPSKKPKKQTPKKKPTIFSTASSPAPEETHTPPEVVTGVSSQQEPTDGRAELLKLEKETAPKPAAQKTADPAAKSDDAPKEAGDQPKRRRKFKRPPPENTIRMTIRQYWRFRTWIANRKLGLSPDVIGAVLEGTDQVLVEPLVEPVVGIIDEYVPEKWIEFIEEKSPLLTLLIALFEAEQTFAARIAQIAREVRTETPGPQTTQQPQQARPVYPSQ